MAVAPGDSRYIISGGSTDGPSADGGRASVYASADGGANWRRTDGAPAGQVAPFPDVDIVATSTGRLVAAELDQAGINIVVAYSDEAGRTWTRSTGLAKLQALGFTPRRPPSAPHKWCWLPRPRGVATIGRAGSVTQDVDQD